MWSTNIPTSPGNNALLTTCTITLSCLATPAHHADSWWLGHVVTDDVVMADITGQALDIFLHGPESAHKNGILKTFTHTSIPIHPCTFLKQTKSKTLKLTKHHAFVHLCPSCPVSWWATARKLGRSSSDIFLHGPEPTRKNSIVKTNIHSHIHFHPPMHTPKTNSKILNSSNRTTSFSSPLRVQCGGGRRPGRLASAPRGCSTSEAFSPRTVLTENICTRVQQIFQHRPATIPFLTT